MGGKNKVYLPGNLQVASGATCRPMRCEDEQSQVSKGVIVAHSTHTHNLILCVCVCVKQIRGKNQIKCADISAKRVLPL